MYVELDGDPTEEELSEAIDSFSNGKAPGEDGIPAIFLKENMDVLLSLLHALLLQCWRQHETPHNVWGAKIVTLYRNKGDKGGCNNYGGIPLLCVTDKNFARVLKRLQRLADRILPETQSGFRTGRWSFNNKYDLHASPVAGKMQ